MNSFMIVFSLALLGLTSALIPRSCKKNVAFVIAVENAHGLPQTTFDLLKTTAKKSVKRFPNDFRLNVEVAVDGFSSTSTSPNLQTGTKTDILNLFKALTFTSLSTCPKISNALSHATNVLKQKDAATKKIFVYFGTGRSHKDRAQLPTAKADADAAGVRSVVVLPVSATDSQRMRLSQLVDNDPLRMVNPEMTQIYSRIQHEIQPDCITCYTPTMDIVFLIDQSRSSDPYKTQMTTLLKTFLDKYPIGNSQRQIRAAFVPFAQIVYDQGIIPFSDTATRQSLKTQVDNMKTLDPAYAVMSMMGLAMAKALEMLKSARTNSIKMIVGVADTLHEFHDLAEAKIHAETARSQGMLVYLASFYSGKINHEFFDMTGDAFNLVSLDPYVQPTPANMVTLGDTLAKRTCTSFATQNAFRPAASRLT